MGTITLEKIHEDLQGLKKEISQIKDMLKEDFEVSDEVIKEVKASRLRSKKDLVSQDEMRKEFN